MGLDHTASRYKVLPDEISVPKNPQIPRKRLLEYVYALPQWYHRGASGCDSVRWGRRAPSLLGGIAAGGPTNRSHPFRNSHGGGGSAASGGGGDGSDSDRGNGDGSGSGSGSGSDTGAQEESDLMRKEMTERLANSEHTANLHVDYLRYVH